MEKSAVFHQSDSQYSYPVSDTKAEIWLRVKKNDDIRGVRVIWNTQHYFYRERFVADMWIDRTDLLFDYYKAELDNGYPGYSYLFEITDGDGSLWYYNESGFDRQMRLATTFEDNFNVIFPNERDIVYQNKLLDGRLFYQIFPERFNKSSDKKYTDYIDMDWDTEEPDNSHFAGGDLKGIEEKLDYLKELGIGGIYMTPIHPSISAHKYDVDDYLAIDKMFGTMEDLKSLVKSAHEKDILIVLDLVYNHSSYLHPFFQDVVKNGRESKYYDWYFVDGDKPDWDKLNYKTFCDVRMMPKLNTNNPEVQEYLTQVAEFYMKECKVDGFRLDVAYDVSHDFWRFFKARLKKIDPNVFIIGEDWQNSDSFLGNDQWDSVMNYPFLFGCKRYLAEERYDGEQFCNFLNGALMRYKDGINRNMLNLLDSHDIARFYTTLGENIDRELMAQAALLFYQGCPMIYYGDEVFMTGENDPYNRKPMKWNSPMYASPEHAFLKQLLMLRQQEVLKKGDIHLYAKDGVAYIRRSYEGKTLTLALNRTKEEKTLDKTPVLSHRVEGMTMLPNSLAVLEG